MTKVYPWQQSIIDNEKNMTTNELLNTVLFWAGDDNIDDEHLIIGWIFNYYVKKLYKRLDFILPDPNEITSFNYEPVTN